MDEKRYSQKGIGTVVELGKGGAKIKDSSGVIEHRNNADDAYAIARGGSPVGDDDLTTKEWVEDYTPRVEADVDYYVDGTSGSDSNDGSDWANAKKTFDFLYSGGTGALARTVNATVNVYCKGTLRGVNATRHTVLDTLKGTGVLNIIGTMTSLETFTITGYDDDPTNIDGRMYLDASGASWTVDEHEGHFQKVAASSTYRPIASNTATQLRMNNAPLSPGATSDIYSATSFLPEQESNPGTEIAYTSGNFFAIKDCELEINVSNIDFRSTTQTVQPAVEDSIHVSFVSCAMRRFLAIRAKNTALIYCYMKFVDWTDWVSAATSNIILNSCTVDGNSQGYGVYSGGRSFVSLFNTYILNHVEGLSGDGTNFNYIGSSSYFEGNTYGILQNGEPISIDAWSTGGTPTRFKNNTTAWQFGGPVLGSAVEAIVHSGNTTEIRLSPNVTKTFAQLNAQQKIANAGAGSNIIYQSGASYLLTVPEEFDPSISAGLSTYTYQEAIDELAAAAYADPLTTRGDLLVRSASATIRRAIGAAGTVLYSDGTDPTWAQILGGMVELAEIGTATYDDVQDWSNTTQSAGVISGGVITDGGSGTVDVSDVKGIVKTTNSEIGENRYFDLTGLTGQTLTDNNTNYISVNYNSGTPQFVVGTSNTANGHTIFNLGKVYREGTTVDIITSGLQIQDLGKRIQQHHLEQSDLHFTSGATVAETGTLNIAIDAGVMYAGLNRILTDAIDTSGADTFEYYYYTGAAWTESDQSAIDADNYNNIATGLAALSNNKFGVHWVYKGTNGTTYVVYGQGNYTLTEAQQAQPPASLPDHVNGFGVLRAKIIVGKGETTFAEIESVTEVSFTSSTPSAHNDLTLKQGGAADEYYHATAAEYTVLQNTSGSNTGDQDLTGLVTKATFDANTILKADADDTPSALTVAEQTLVGRITAGVITALTATQVRTLLNVEDGAEANNISDVDATDLTDAGDSTLHYHSSDRDRANHTGTQALATISDIVVTSPANEHALHYDSTSSKWVNHEQNLSAIYIDGINTPTDRTVETAFSISGTPAHLSGGVITKNGDGTIDISEGEFLLHASNSLESAMRVVRCPAYANFALTDNSPNTIYVDPNGGSPTYAAHIPAPGFFEAHWDYAAFAIVTRVGTTLHLMDARDNSKSYGYRRSLREAVSGNLIYGSGMAVADEGSLEFSVTAGTCYLGNITLYTTDAFDTSVADTFTSVYRDGAGGWTRTAAQTAIDNLYYDDGTGTLAALSNNKFGVYWVYIVGNTPDVLYVLYGQDNYSTLALAEEADPIASVPPELSPYGSSILAAKIIVEKGATAFDLVQSPYTSVFTARSINVHNGLGSLQGGTADQYYHATAAEYTVLQNTSGANTGDQDLSGLVTKATFDANTILKADADDTPAALTVAEQTLVGRITSGTVAALTATQVRTLINVADGADVGDVIGPATSADNSVAAFDGTDNKTLQASPVKIDSDGNVTVIKTIQTNTAYDIGSQATSFTMTLSNGIHQKVNLTGASVAMTISDTGVGDGTWHLEIARGTASNAISGVTYSGTLKGQGGELPDQSTATDALDTWAITKRGTVIQLALAQYDMQTIT